MKEGASLWVEKIYTRTGITKENIFCDGEKVLHIGPGKKVLAGAVGIDVLNLPEVDIVHNLNVVPWPFSKNEFDLIFAHNVFEHLDDLVGVMEEMWRILKPGGRLVITVPYFRSTDAFTDPTHRHFFTSRSLDYFIDAKTLAGYAYTEKKFSKKGFWFGWPQDSRNPLVRVCKYLIHKYSKFYDSYLSLLFPMKIIVWELEVIKK